MLAEPVDAEADDVFRARLDQGHCQRLHDGVYALLEVGLNLDFLFVHLNDFQIIGFQ